MWLDWQVVIGVPHDMPIVGYGGQTVNYLRLFSARASHEVDMSIFNARRLHQAPSSRRCCPRRSPKCSTPATRSPPAASCG